MSDVPKPAGLVECFSLRRLDEYMVGKDTQGNWIAMEIHGHAGGLFVSLEAARRFAERETEKRPGAVRLLSEPVAFRA